jgi:alkanesulfonate monooxygenase SsuD/methylene tetrahydromethanopterin reductase-like flavin-dependent oxidoreductase (luciferase family)
MSPGSPHVGLGLPVDDPDVLLEWARRADVGPFRTLGFLDRLVWHNPEPLVTLAALAGATTRIRLQTEVLLAPLRATALLGAQAATLDRLSGGRFTLGLGVGGRADDFAVAGVPVSARGRRLDEQMAALRAQWAPDADPSSGRARPGPADPRCCSARSPSRRWPGSPGSATGCCVPPRRAGRAGWCTPWNGSGPRPGGPADRGWSASSTWRSGRSRRWTRRGRAAGLLRVHR